MTRFLHVFHDPPLDGPANMARDGHLLYAEDLRPAALRLYGWEPATISLGYFQRHADLAQLPAELAGSRAERKPAAAGRKSRTMVNAVLG